MTCCAGADCWDVLWTLLDTIPLGARIQKSEGDKLYAYGFGVKKSSKILFLYHKKFHRVILSLKIFSLCNML